MEFIQVGQLNLPQIGLGTFPMKGKELKCALDTASVSGYTLFDTAYKYKNELELGKFIRGEKGGSTLIVQTKLSITQLKIRRILGIKISNETPQKAFKHSLNRLSKEIMDVYLLHSPFKDFSEVYQDLIRLYESGMVKAIGVCRFDVQQLELLHKKTGRYPMINQLEVHPYYNNKEVIEFCLEHNIAIEARSPFAHGDALPQFVNEPILKEIALHYGKTVPQVILRWIVQQGLISIVKSSNPQHIRDNINIFDFTLTDAQMKKIDSLNKNVSYGCISSSISR